MRFDFSPTDLKEAMYDYLVKKRHLDPNEENEGTHDLHVWLSECSAYDKIRVKLWLTPKDKPASSCKCGKKKT